MKNLRINKKTIGALALTGIILIGSHVGYTAHAKSISTCELSSTSIEEILENEDIRDMTQVDEAIEAGECDIVERDKEFRKHAAELTYDNYINDRAFYEENLIWLNQNYNYITEDILLSVGKGTVAEATDEDMNKIRLYPVNSSELRDPFITSRGTVEIKTDLYNTDVYNIKSTPLENLINETTNIQSKDYYFKDGKEIEKAYDKVLEEAEMVMITGANVHNNNIEEKYDVSYAKKHIKK